jgi:iron complex transport system ATP-binding protein
MTLPLLEVDQLCFAHGNKQLLQNIQLSINPGELVGIIGPNGAGKSTLLKSIVGINKPQKGHVLINGEPISSLNHLERARVLSYLAQHQHTTFPFTARQTIELGTFSNLSGSTQAALKTTELAESLGIEKLLDQKMDELSGGENQLVHFARILNQQSPLMLLDEPTASLDIGHEAQLMNLLRTHCKDGHSAFVALHNLNIAAAFCDRLILLDQGLLLNDGPPETVITQDQMQKLYDNQVMVSQNPITGTTTVLPMPEAQAVQSLKVHIIGGAGSAVALSRTLLQMGVQLSGGISHDQDSDTEFWKATGVPHVEIAAFSAVNQDAVNRAKPMITAADITILCEFPVGVMNDMNLELAQFAKNLLILDSGMEDSTRFSTPESQRQYDSLITSENVVSPRAAVQRVQSLLSNS